MAMLEELGIATELQDKLVMGESISQVLQFLLTGNADAAFLARAQQPAVPDPCTSRLRSPPVVQQAILLQDSPAAREFMRFLQGPTAAAIIAEAGYELPLTQSVIEEPDR